MTLIYIRDGKLFSDRRMARESSVTSYGTNQRYQRKYTRDPENRFIYATTGVEPEDLLEQVSLMFEEITIWKRRGCFVEGEAFILNGFYKSELANTIVVIGISVEFSFVFECDPGTGKVMCHNITNQPHYVHGSGKYLALPLLDTTMADSAIFESCSLLDSLVSASFDVSTTEGLVSYDVDASVITAHEKLYSIQKGASK